MPNACATAAIHVATWRSRRGPGRDASFCGRPPNHPRRPAPYVPDFKKAFDHFCLHAGGRGVIEGLSKQLALPAGKQAPSYN